MSGLATAANNDNCDQNDDPTAVVTKERIKAAHR